MAVISQIKATSDNVNYNIRDDYSTWGGRNLLLNTKNLFPVTGTSSSYFIEYTVNNGKLSNSYALEEGVTYTFSADVTSSIEPFQLTIGAGNGGYSKDVDYGPGQTLTNGRISLTFTPTANQLSSGNIFAFRAPRYSSQGTSFTYTVDRPKLEKGNKATDWSPAPEDIARFIGNETIELYSE